MGIAVGGTIALVVGVLAGVLLFCCISKHCSKPESSSHQQQAGPLYAELRTTSGKEKIVLSDNVAYRPRQTIKLKANESYGHVQH